MTNQERREIRYQNRKNKRYLKKLERNNSLGNLEDIFKFSTVYKWGRKCCNGIRWKGSCQRFELKLFSHTSRVIRYVLNDKWIYSKPYHFRIKERGKEREIDAPRQWDKQIQKIIAKEILTPLYQPSMIYDNGASQKGKGLEFSIAQLKKELRAHFRKYKREGFIIAIDFHSFFPTANKAHIFERHKKIILNEDIKRLPDDLVNSFDGPIGMPLGIEPSQIEMVAFPSELDNYMASQISVKIGHYMDDYHILVPPTRDPKDILNKFIAKAESLGIQINKDKTHIIPLTKKFKFCKITLWMDSKGKIIARGNRKTLSKCKEKLNKFKFKIANKDLRYEDLWCSVNATRGYFNRFNDHNRTLKMQRIFYSIYKFPSDKIEYFRGMDNKCNI